MSTISPSSIKTTKSLQDRLSACHSQPEIAEVLHEEALAQRLVVKEWDESIVSPTKLAQGVGKTVEINGVLHEITGPSESDVLAQETALYRAAMQPVATTTTTTEQPRDTAGRFVAAEQTLEEIAAEKQAAAAETDRQAGLSLQMRLGNISIDQYLEQSGAIEKHIQQREFRNNENGWKSATDEFLHSDEGANWPGGQEALHRVGELIEANNLMDTADKLQALKDVWRFIQHSDYETAVTKTAAEAKTPEELRAAVGYRGTTGLWGR